MPTLAAVPTLSGLDLPIFQPPLRAETELLISCARTQMTPAMAQRIQTLCAGVIDWDDLLQQSQKQGVLPLLFKSLEAICRDLVPADIFQQLQTLYRQNALKNIQFTGELVQLLDLLHAQGFEAFCFKGPALAIAAYGSLSLRSFGDLDILVRSADYFKVRDYLTAEGYQSSILLWHFSKAEEEAYLQNLGECPLIHPSRGVCVEIHQRLIAGFMFQLSASFDDVWPRLAPVSLIGKSIDSLSIEDLLLYLCIHGAKDSWRRLSWVCDISELIQRHPSIKWHFVLKLAEEHGAVRMLHIGLCLANQLLGTPLPDSIQVGIQTDEPAGSLARSIMQDLCNEMDPHGQATTPRLGATLSQFWFHLQMMERWPDLRQQVRLYFEHWFLVPLRNGVKPTAKDRLFLTLPDVLYFLYYFVRPIRLLKEAWARHCTPTDTVT